MDALLISLLIWKCPFLRFLLRSSDRYGFLVGLERGTSFFLVDVDKPKFAIMISKYSLLLSVILGLQFFNANEGKTPPFLSLHPYTHPWTLLLWHQNSPTLRSHDVLEGRCLLQFLFVLYTIRIFTPCEDTVENWEYKKSTRHSSYEKANAMNFHEDWTINNLTFTQYSTGKIFSFI